MKAAAFLNLPVQSGRVRIVNLHAIDAEVVLLRDWMFGVDKGQGNEWAHIFLPGREDWKLSELHLLLHNFGNRGPRYFARSQLQKIPHQPAMLPKFRSIWREQRFSYVDYLFDEFFRLAPKSQVNSFGVPNRLVTTGKRLPFTRLKSSAGPPLSITRRWISASFQIGIDFGIDCDDIFFAGKQFEKCT
jgi:hypothetical protein